MAAKKRATAPKPTAPATATRVTPKIEILGASPELAAAFAAALSRKVVSRG